MAVEHVFGSGLFMDKEAIDFDTIMDVAPKEWFPGMSLFKIYAYVEFPSLERAYYGLAAVKGDPTSDWVASALVDQTVMEGVASLTEFGEALRYLEEESDYMFEEVPFVEVTREEDYNRALAIVIDVDAPTSVKDWSPSVKKMIEKESSWMGPGVYDFRDKPPTQSFETVEAYEGSGLEFEAEHILEYMFQGDEWKNSLRELIPEIREKA